MDTIDTLCGFIAPQDSPHTGQTERATTGEDIVKSYTTPRKVYDRYNLTHICLRGRHWAHPDARIAAEEGRPYVGTIARTRVDRVDVLSLEAARRHGHDEAIVVTQLTDGREVKDVWVPIRVPRRHKAGPDCTHIDHEGAKWSFCMASAAQLTGWTY